MSSVKSNSICFIVIIQSSSNLLAAVSMRIENRSSGRKTSWKKGFPNVFHHLSTQFVVAKTIWSFCCLTLPTGRRGRRQDSICGHTTFLVMNFILTFHSTSYYWEESLKAILCPKWWTWMNKMGLYHVYHFPFLPSSILSFLAEALPDAVPTFEAKLSKVKAKIAFRLFSGMFAISSLKRKTVGQLFKIYHCSLGLWLSPHFTLLYITYRWLNGYFYTCIC